MGGTAGGATFLVLEITPDPRLKRQGKAAAQIPMASPKPFMLMTR